MIPKTSTMRLLGTLTLLAILPRFVFAQVSSNVMVSVAGNTEVHVFEDVTNTGDFDINASALLHVRGDIELSGSSQQHLGGHVIVDKLHQDNGSGVVVEAGSQVEVYEALELNTGQMTANAAVIIKSVPAWTAYVDDFSAGFNGTYSGNLTMERYVASTGFHHVGGAVDVSNIASELSEASLSGPDGGQVIPLPDCNPNAIDGTSPYGNMFEWRENASFLFSCYQSGWFVRSSGAMVNGRGYSLTKSGNTNFELTGPPHLSAVTYNSLTNTGGIGNGFHLVSNPYPCDIEWTFIAGYGAAAYIWQSTGTYAGTYQATFPGGGARIASQQAFFVQRASGTGNFSIPLSSRRTGSSTFFRQASNEGLEIIVKGHGFADRALVNFDEMASENWEPNVDALKIQPLNDQPYLAANFHGEDFGVNTLNLENVQAIPMTFISGVEGAYEFSFNTSEPGFMLEDKKLKYYGALGKSYKFQYKMDDRDDRFVIHRKSMDQIEEQAAIEIYGTVNSMVVRGNIEGSGRLDLLDMTGRVVWSSNSIINKGSNDFAKPIVASGLYILRVNLNDQIFEERLLF